MQLGPDAPTERTHGEVVAPMAHLLLRWSPPPQNLIWVSRAGQPVPRRLEVPFNARRVYIPPTA